jgi:nucleoside-diphosphate-sugar epimerase
MRALVTGATGMLGARLVERLAEAGWEVRGLVRDPSRAAWLAEAGATPVRGDLTDAASLRAAAAGCDAVFGAAAAIGAGSDDAFSRVNVDGTRSLVAATAAAGARLVHVSSTSVFGRHRYRARPTDEWSPLPELPEAFAYGRSKQDAERVVLGAHTRGEVWAAVVRPPVMYGPRDRQFVPRVAPVLRRGLFPLVGSGRTTLPLVSADAVALGAIRAATTDAAGGQVYHLTDDFPVTPADLVRLAAQGLGRRVLAPRVPVVLGRAAFRVLALALRAGGRGDLAPHAIGLLEMLTRDNPFSSARARRELGWSPALPPAEGLPAAFRWWAERRSTAGRRGSVEGDE